ncbi:MAG TPA: polyhydroxyalkanoate depolymerase [Burkholderiales bacterium]|nr:polyhydroxyalkanoate depolymerase [Burkholderiales bacterium]
MLYDLHEFQRATLAPLLVWAQANASLFSSPYSALSYMPASRNMAAGYDLLFRLGKRYEKPEFGFTKTVVDGKEVAVTEEVVLGKPFCNLLHFKRDITRNDPKVLVVAPLSGHHSTLLRDTVRAMLPDLDVYITDWIDAKLVPLSKGAFHLDDYVEYIKEFIRHIGHGINVISVCQPTVPALAAISLMAQHNDPAVPATMTMMGGPIDPRKSPTSVNAFAMKKTYSWFEQNVIQRVPAKYPGYMRRVYPGFLQYLGFVAMNPDRHMSSHWDYYNHLVQGDGDSADSHRQFYDEYNAVLDMPAEYYLDTIKRVFHNHDLPKGKFMVRGVRVEPKAITKTALFTIEGELDDISGSGQTQAAHELCTSIPKERRQHLTAKGAGHYGIFSGRRYREKIYPQIRDFIRKHS